MSTSAETLRNTAKIASLSSLLLSTKIVLDVFNDNVLCAGKNGAAPYITKTAGETITVDPDGHSGFAVHISKIGDSGSSWFPRFRIENPNLVKVELDTDKTGPYKRLEFANSIKQVVIFERC